MDLMRLVLDLDPKNMQDGGSSGSDGVNKEDQKNSLRRWRTKSAPFTFCSFVVLLVVGTSTSIWSCFFVFSSETLCEKDLRDRRPSSWLLSGESFTQGPSLEFFSNALVTNRNWPFLMVDHPAELLEPFQQLAHAAAVAAALQIVPNLDKCQRDACEAYTPLLGKDELRKTCRNGHSRLR